MTKFYVEGKEPICKEDSGLTIELEQDGDCIDLVAIKNGEKQYICKFRPDGRIKLYYGISSRFGLQLGCGGKIKVVN